METVRKIIHWKLFFILTWWPILTLMWCLFWFIFIFSPLEQGDAYLKVVSPTKFAYVNASRKPFPSDLICNIKGSVTVVETNLGTEYQKNQPTDKWGTGNSDWTTWKITGSIPFGAETLRVHKELTYSCLGVLNKKVLTKGKLIDIDKGRF